MDRLSNTVRPYAWGSTTAIPALLGTAPTGEPQAEMWMGAHPGAPSRIARPQSATDTTHTTDATTPAEHPLTDVIAADPEGELGAATVARFGPRLPFLLKLLAAGSPSPSRSTPTWTRPARATRTKRPGASRSTPLTARTRTRTTSPNSSAPSPPSTASAASAGPPRRPTPWRPSASTP